MIPRAIVRFFESTGTVEAPFSVKIGPKVTGRIVYLVVREGNPVHNGETLVKLDPTEAQAQVRQARGAVAEAQQRYVQAELTRHPTNVNIVQQIRQTRESVTSATADRLDTRWVMIDGEEIKPGIYGKVKAATHIADLSSRGFPISTSSTSPRASERASWL